MLDALFKPRGVAVIGASSKELHIGNRVIKNLLDFGFTGRIYPINPKASEIYGHKAYPSVLQLPETPDLAVIVIIAAIVGIGCLALIIGIAIWVVSVIARGGLIAGVQQVEEQEHTSFGLAWRAGRLSCQLFRCRCGLTESRRFGMLEFHRLRGAFAQRRGALQSSTSGCTRTGSVAGIPAHSTPATANK